MIASGRDVEAWQRWLKPARHDDRTALGSTIRAPALALARPAIIVSFAAWR